MIITTHVKQRCITCDIWKVGVYNLECKVVKDNWMIIVGGYHMKVDRKRVFTFATLGVLSLVLVACGPNTDDNPGYYNISWHNYDGSLLKSDVGVEAGTLPVYDGPTPVREADDLYNYTFAGWNPEVVIVSADATYTATFDAVSKGLETYTITWKNYDGTVLETDDAVPVGTLPTYNGNEPSKPEDTENTYTFSGWDPEVVEVSADAEYVATFTSEAKTPDSYMITWKDTDGTIIDTTQVVPGDIPTHPLPGDTAQWHYLGWSPLPSAAHASATYTATREIQHYTLTFVTGEGTPVETIEEHYGVEIKAPVAPTRSNYNFDGWFYEPTFVNPVSWPLTLTGDLEIYAKWDSIGVIDPPDKNTFTIIWKNYNGAVLETDTAVPMDTIPTYDGAIPTRPMDVGLTYTFAGWDPEIVAANDDAEYIAQYTSETRNYQISWFNTNGSLIGTDVVPYGTVPSHALPADTMQWDYTGWNPAPIAVTGNASYTAVRNIKQYTLIFESNGGSEVPMIEENYGTVISEPATPTKDGQDFHGWYLESQLINPVVWPLTLTDYTTIFASWSAVPLQAQALSQLFRSCDVDPINYLPDSMWPGANLVEAYQTNINFTNFVDTGSIPHGAHGDQWNMVIENIAKAYQFIDYLDIVIGMKDATLIPFKEYLILNPATSGTYATTLQEIYNVTINYDSEHITYELLFEHEMEGLGSEDATIELTYDLTTDEKVGLIHLSETNVLRYVVRENHYEFGVAYLGASGAFFEINENPVDGTISGSVYEYGDITYLLSNGSSAQFFIDDQYVSVIGDRADGMILTAGVINELYLVENGLLLGYEVLEDSIYDYESIWLSLDQLLGINSIKVTDHISISGNPNAIYINGSDETFATKTMPDFLDASRRYDIEMRNQHLYYMENDQLMHAVREIPMFFVQEEVLDSVISDVLDENSNCLETFGITLEQVYLEKIMSEFDLRVEPYRDQKASFNFSTILDLMGL